MKYCKSCDKVKSLDQFYSFKKTRDDRRWVNHSTLCRVCHNKQVVSSRKKHEEDDPYYKTKRLLRDIEGKCRKNSLSFDLDEDWIIERRRKGVCEITGIPFDDGEGLINQRPWGFSIDRVDQGGGYTKDNSKAVVWAYNRAKGVGTHEDVMRLAEALCNRTR